ncbi:hypothetical protein Enr13x_75220 [Stieleria neptunia]|uniref:Uncharacterized protein n=1 Tax=Stieleria neptunia TaxID=2527979 RepID=A0A518I3C9_9BACT|nr:hypothetical protein [Stieleria neptunia]QDV47611.1 hypothetical protein Enr13x_75220 [Stieleria neptunia]
MTEKEPVLLTVLIESATRRWSVAGVTLDGRAVPLMCTEPGDFDPVVGATLDEQTSYLRHRLSGVLQRGCDRLWGRQMKPRHIVFVADDGLEQSHPNLTQRVADHFAEWMTSPPVAFFICTDGWSGDAEFTLDAVAGELDPTHYEILTKALPPLIKKLDDRQAWEIAASKPPA